MIEKDRLLKQKKALQKLISSEEVCEHKWVEISKGTSIKHEYIKERVRESLERTYCKVPTGNSCEVEYVLSKCTKCKKIKKDYTNEPKVIDKEGQPPLTGTGAFILKKRKLAISMIGKK